MEKKTAIQLALEIITKKNKPISFLDIFKYVKTKLGISDEEANEMITEFYTELSCYPTLVNVGNNMWTLRDRCTYDSIKFEVPEDERNDEEEAEEEEREITQEALKSEGISEEEDAEEANESEEGEF